MKVVNKSLINFLRATGHERERLGSGWTGRLLRNQAGTASVVRFSERVFVENLEF